MIFDVKCLICHVHAALSCLHVLSFPLLSPSSLHLHLHLHRSLTSHLSLRTRIKPPPSFSTNPDQQQPLTEKKTTKQPCPNYSVMSVFILYSLLFQDINNKNKHNTSQGSVSGVAFFHIFGCRIIIKYKICWKNVKHMYILYFYMLKPISLVYV